LARIAARLRLSRYCGKDPTAFKRFGFAASNLVGSQNMGELIGYLE
jgi:hypothetical protein